MKITICNWDKHNPRADVKHTAWLRLNNSIITAQDVFELNFEEKWAWISILCLASQKQKATIEIDPKWFSHHTQISESALGTALEKLIRNGCVTCTSRVRTRTSRARHVDVTLQTDRQTDKQTGKTPAPKAPYFLIQSLWEENRESFNGQKVYRWSEGRKRAASSRWSEIPDPDTWHKIFSKIRESPFLRGDVAPGPGRRRFKADIDWLLKPDTPAKILEGKYDDTERRAIKAEVSLAALRGAP